MPYAKKRASRAPSKNYRRRVRRYGGKRRSHSKSNRYASKARLTRFSNGIADNTLVKLKYADVVDFPDFTASPAGVSILEYCGNRINDPGLTLDNHNSNASNIWNQMYNNYQCYASKIHVQLIAGQEDVQFMATLRAVSVDAETGSAADVVTQAMTDANTRYTILGAEDSAKGIRTLSMFRSFAKILGHGNQSRVSGATVTTVNNIRPTNITNDVAIDPHWKWLLTLSDMTESTATGSPAVRALVKITYYCKFINRVDVDMSTNA